jgi:mono/diheme cytochrome c family protein
MTKTLFIVLSLLTIILLLFIIGCKKAEKQPEASKQSVVQSTQKNIGEKLFNEHCVMCHPDDNRMKDIKKPNDIIKAMRNPKSGMPKFNEEEIPNDAAEAITKYIFSSILFQK